MKIQIVDKVSQGIKEVALKATVTGIAFRFPKRFEIEGLDPFTLKVQVVTKDAYKVFETLEKACQEVNLHGFCGPMADKIDGNWCIRFESKEVYASMCN